jgi:glutamate formiminotransferase
VFQCPVNLSEGRNERAFTKVREAMSAIPGVALADLSMDPDHHRMVVSLLGGATGLKQAVLGLYEIASQEIDLRQHEGLHPRIGAVDVVPFVPLQGSTMEEAIELSLDVARSVAERFQLPIILYEESARHPEHQKLPDLRREGLQERLDRLPADFGPPQLHPQLGASVMGARRPLVAFNVVLESEDVRLAKDIAKHMRNSPGVRSLGWYLGSKSRVQVSMNLTDPATFDLHQAFERVRSLAAEQGVDIHSSELIGLAPATSFVKMAQQHLRMESLQPDQLLERNYLPW